MLMNILFIDYLEKVQTVNINSYLTWFWSVQCYIPTQKICSIAPKQLQTTLRIFDGILCDEIIYSKPWWITEARLFSGTMNENNSKTFIRPEDLAIVELKLKDTKLSYKFVGFGFIKTSGKLNRNDGKYLCLQQNQYPRWWNNSIVFRSQSGLQFWIHHTFKELRRKAKIRQ